MPLLIQNLHGHIFVLIVMTLELIVNAVPTSMYHIVFLWIFGIIYAAATYIGIFC